MMKILLTLLFVSLSFSHGVCMNVGINKLFEPSTLGCVYRDLSKAHLAGKFLTTSEVKRAESIVGRYNFSSWDSSQVKLFELDKLFYVGIVMEMLGHRDLAADMIFFAHEKGYDDNFVIESLRGQKIDKQSIVTALEKLGLDS